MPETTKAREKEQQRENPEICIWMTFRGGVCELMDLQERYRKGKVSQKEYTKQVNANLVELSETADLTHQFGILLPAHIEKPRRKEEEDFLQANFSPYFWRWYNWWGDYVNALSKKQLNELYAVAMERLPDVELYRPAGDWMRYRSDPSVLVVGS